MLDTFFFYMFAALTLLGGLFTVTLRNAVHSAIALIVSLLGVAGLYLMQKAEFLFAVQIILYIGGIMLLFLFVIMLVNLDEALKQKQFNSQWALALVCLGGVGALVAYFLAKGQGAFPWGKPIAAIAGAPTGNTQILADVLFRDYLLPFEVASILLLVAVVGCVFMAKKESAAK
ncbi:MAG TPA: NADH-quinone oxidoreductase subunit J [Bryobacteraceae bacterium]|nr:NADH-quinone oxidoreductase subunit J [Bryobacteraceae bacterium]